MSGSPGEVLPARSMPEWVTLDEAASYLKISKPTLYRWIAEDRVRSYDLPAGRGRRMKREDLDDLLEQPRAPARISRRREDAPEPVRERFESALASLVRRLESDRTVVAAVLWGSLAHARVWERSDIDLLIVRDDQKARRGSGWVSLTELGVLINASVVTRAEFRRMAQSAQAGTFWQSAQSLGRILFTRDEGLRGVFEEARALGKHDRRVALLGSAARVAPLLDKAEKWLQVAGDPHYAAVWTVEAVRGIAPIEVLLHDEIPGREALVRALDLNPDFFGRAYTRFLDAPKTQGEVRSVLDLVDGYLTARQDEVFGLLLDYLRDEATVRSLTDISRYLERQHGIGGAAWVCSWLAGHGILVATSMPYFLTEHSRVELDEQAYLIPG